MKHLLFAALLVSLFSCQKENRNEEEKPPVIETPPPPPAAIVCKVSSVREYPAVAGNSMVRNFTYDDKARVVKVEVQAGTATVTRNINYNTDGKIDNISNSNGFTEKFTYTGGALTTWEAFDAAGKPLKKSTFSYEGSKLQREDRHVYNATAAAYELADYMTFEWDANGNITAIKTYGADNVLKVTDAYTYDTTKENKQQTITPQMNLMFMNWGNDITAFINSKHLLNDVLSKKRKLVYQTNEAGLITTVKNDKGENLFDFTYGCSN